VKRWLKGEGGGLLAVARGMVKGHGEDGAGLAGEVEVRFEWKRGRAKGKRGRGEKHKAEEGEEKAADPMKSTGVGRRTASSANLSAAAGAPARLSMNIISRQSSFSTNAASEDGHAIDFAKRRSSVAHGDDSGEESDPEDSETPWTCTVKIRRLAIHRTHSHGLSFGREAREEKEREEQAQWERSKKEVLRIKVGTLSPTPHHPKVVAMLKVPFPLPDVDIERMVAHKREGGPGSPKTGALGSFLHVSCTDTVRGYVGPGLMLTAEEIKDVVCSTGLWLVVREGFGGVGKVSRKGDGWRIRG
jgi:hypothetical protein